MSFAAAAHPVVILGLVPRTQLSTCSVVAGKREWQTCLQFSLLASVARWVLGTRGIRRGQASPRMTFERNALFSHGAHP
jgi:hypothetical protein